VHQRKYCIRLLALLVTATFAGGLRAQLRATLASDPKTFDPLLTTEAVSETIRFLTSGVLIRFNRATQNLEPELATSWKVSEQGRRMDFVLRHNVSYSDGVAFDARDVVATMQRLATPGLLSGIADTFHAAGGQIKAQALAPDRVSILFSQPIANPEMLFDQLAITPARKVAPETAVLGPFVVAEYKAGRYVLLRRNPNYWKTGERGAKLPYLDSVRLDIQPSREAELLRYQRGEYHLIDNLEPEAFERLAREKQAGARNTGPSLDSEFLWFNQSPKAHIPDYKAQWFREKAFRQAVSAAINRDDIIRLVYRGYAHAAVGPVSTANKMWFNSRLSRPVFKADLALRLLGQAGFRLRDGVLRDREGHEVEFSLITNANSETRKRIGAVLQQDLAKIGVRLNLVPLEFQSLIERITRTQQYEACLLGFSNVELDPNEQMNIWLSSGDLHPWNPGQAKPATAWEAEIDRLLTLQHSTNDYAKRKKAFDTVQEIVADEAAAIFLVNPDVLVAISPLVRNAAPSALPPHLFWNIEYLSLSRQ
jgi:peptide/nickel transport system substrate-binding protein